MVKICCSVILVCWFASFGRAQELYGKFLNHEQGLLSKECYDIHYDEKGYLIVGTQYGPMKYDGEKFIPICTNLPLERRVMYDFEKAPDGTVYLLNSLNELFHLKNDTAIALKVKNQSEFARPFVFTKLDLKPDGIYITSYFQFVKYSFKTHRIERYYERQHNGFRFIYDSRNEFPFLKFSEGYAFKDMTQIEFPESGQIFQVSSEADSREAEIQVGKTTYLLVNMRLFRKKGNQVKKLDFNGIYFCEYFHGRLWLSTLTGLYELDTEGNLVHHHFKGLIVAGVAPLKSGGIAVSFNKEGVFISSDINNRIHYNFTATGATSINQQDLVGSLNGEIYKFQDHKLTILAQSGIREDETKRSYLDGILDFFPYKHYLLSYSGNGIGVFTPGFKKVNELKDRKNAFFGLFAHKDHFYLLTRNAVIKTTWKDLNTSEYPYHFSSWVKLNYFRCHARLNDSTILIGTNNGLFKYNLHTDQLSPVDLPVKEAMVTSVCLSGKNNYLVCTRYKGIYLMNGFKVLKRIPPPCISVSKLLLYRGQLIARGNDGIYIRNLDKAGKSTWIKFFSGETEKMFVLQNSLLISYKNDLIVKQLSGYQTVYKPRIVLNKFELGNTQVKYFPGTIPSNTPISIDVDILQFDANTLNLYYKLTGENTISQFAEGTKINFDVLKSGKYQLELFPVIDGKIQFSNSKIVRFTIEETFWESTIFYIGSGILAIFILFSIFLLMNLRRKKRSAERSELESKLNEYKLLAVKAQVNPHFLSNGLSAIQALILKEDNDLAAQYLAKFSYLMRKILLYSEQQFISIGEELQLVDAYLELELLRFRNKFSVQKSIHLKNEELTQYVIPSLLLQPILENAIWHGLRDQEKNPMLQLLFEINEKRELIIEIRDNGYGFKEKDPRDKHFSKGNQLIHERITTLNKQFEVPVALLEILTSPNGTTVRFVFSPKLYNVPV